MDGLKFVGTNFQFSGKDLSTNSTTKEIFVYFIKKNHLSIGF